MKKGTIKGQLKDIMIKFVKAGKQSFMMKAKHNKARKSSTFCKGKDKKGEGEKGKEQEDEGKGMDEEGKCKSEEGKEEIEDGKK